MVPPTGLYYYSLPRKSTTENSGRDQRQARAGAGGHGTGEVAPRGKGDAGNGFGGRGVCPVSGVIK